MESELEVSGTRRELGSERADAFSRTASVVALGESTQSSTSAEVGGLLSLFSHPGFPSLSLYSLLEPLRLWLLRRKRMILDIP